MSRQSKTAVQWDWGEQLIQPLEKVVERVAAYDPDNATSDFEETLLEQLSISGGESFTAEDHRGREILELLQNAQDAAGGLYEPESDPKIGTRGVYVGISDDGIVVANTGDTFDFSNPERRKSLQILGHSETSEETIGQFGVGLTSIRSMGEAYEVWTKDPDKTGTLNPQDCWRVFCGPRTTLAAIASAAPTAIEEGQGENAYERFRETVVDSSEVLDVSTDTNSIESVPLSPDQLPYFTYPVAMQSWDQSLEDPTNNHAERPLRERAVDLLTYGETSDSDLESCPTEIQSLLSDVGTFTTAVFVDFEDLDWRTLFESITGTRPESPDENPVERLENQAWFDSSDTNRVTPELLLNLGHIDRLVVERFGDGTDEPSSFQSWEVFGRQRVEEADATDLPIDGREISHGAGTEEVDAREVAVQLETANTHEHLDMPSATDKSTYTFWDTEFTKPKTYDDYDWYDSTQREEKSDNDSDVDTNEDTQISDRTIEVSVLFQTTTSDADRELYTPHLYYPISGAENQFPYCIHGDFVVQQNRQSLAGTGLVRNCVVAAEAARLIGHLSETLATAEDLSQAERAAIPWRLLPKPIDDGTEDTDWPTAEGVASKSVGQVADNEPLRVLRAATYRQLRHRDNIQVVSTGGSPTSLTGGAENTQNVLLHYDPTVLAGISALYPLVTCADAKLDPNLILQRADSAVDISLPTGTTLDALLRWLVDRPLHSETVDGCTASDDSDSSLDILSAGLLRHVQNTVSTNRASRLEELVSRDDDSDLESRLITPWWTILQTWSDRINTDAHVGCAISEVPAETGQAVLEATVIFGEDHNSFPNGEDFDLTNEGPYLLPCDPLVHSQKSKHFTGEHVAGNVQLVRVESHEARGDHQRHVLRPDSEDTDKIAPPAKTGFSLYLLSKDTSVKSRDIIENADWGTRKYRAPNLYRTLLRDLATRPADVSMSDIQFLVTVYNSINFDSQTTALDAFEGGYHPREQIKTLAKSRATVDNLKPRIDAREVSIPVTLLEGDEPAPGRTVRFDGELLRYWIRNHVESEEDSKVELAELVDDDLNEVTTPPIQTDGPVATLPSTGEGEPISDLSPSDLTTQLGMLGVSVLPGVRTLLIRGDDEHPDRNNVSSWNPTTWETDQNTSLQALQDVLETDVGKDYLNLLMTPPFGPGVSAGHTPKCSVKDYPEGRELSEFDVMMTSWVWLSSEDCTNLTASDLVDVFTHYGEVFTDSILETGWTCGHSGNYIREIDSFVPTLLNWQLRTVSGWDDMEWFHTPSKGGLWTDHTEWGLQYAVLEEDVDKRSTAASAFPRIDPAASPVSESVWRTLGVKELDELNATEAALRLNALIDAASAPGADIETAVRGVEEEASNSAPELPGIEAIDAWNTLYGTLLGIIGTEINNRSDGMTVEKLHFLNRVPAQTSDGTWVGLSYEALDTAVYYDSIESDWENRLAQLEDSSVETGITDADKDGDSESSSAQYLLPRPVSRYITEEAFESLWDATPATRQPAQYPEIERSETIDADGDALQDALADPEIKYGVLAAAPGKEAQTDHRNQYATIVETLRRIDPTSTVSGNRETAWRVTPVESESGLDLDNVKRTSSYAVAYDYTAIDDPTEPVELADLFIAIYGGGNKDSYKLALLGRDVEGKNTVREELRATDVQELEADLRLAAALIHSSITIEPGMLAPPDGIVVSDLRKKIAKSLQDGGSLSPEIVSALDEPVATAINAMCATDSVTYRRWAGKLITRSNTRAGTLQSILSTDNPHEPPSEQQLVAVERLEEALPAYRSTNRLPAFNDLLPNGHPRQLTEVFHDLISEMKKIPNRPNPDEYDITDLQSYSESVTWSDSILPRRDLEELLDNSLGRDSLTPAFHDNLTWFHLAWSLTAADQPPMETPLAEVLVEGVAEFFSANPDEYREKILEITRQDRTYPTKQRSRKSSSDDKNTETDNITLFGQMAFDTDWESPSSGFESDFSATISSRDDGGNSGGGGVEDGLIEQTGDQPRIAELNILKRSYEALSESGLPLERIQSQLAAMRRDRHNYWRPEEGWTDSDPYAVDTLPDPDGWGQSVVKFIIETFDITDEGDVGYDILDLTGWAVRQASDVSESPEGSQLTPYQNPETLTPVPVEVKSVDPDRPSFKFSLNQYQRAYRFVKPVGERGSVPYVLCLVEVSQDEVDHAPRYRVNPYDIIIITCPSDLRQLLPSELSPNENENLVDTLILETIYGGDLMISK